MKMVGVPLQESIEMATLRPAMAMGVSDLIGKIESGYPAVFTTFDEAFSSFEVLSFS